MCNARTLTYPRVMKERCASVIRFASRINGFDSVQRTFLQVCAVDFLGRSF